MNNLIKKLREKTGVGILEAKRILEETKGDFERALAVLKEKGIEEIIGKKNKETKEGLIESYIHSNFKIGVLIELLCETDFAAKNPEFRELAHGIAMQIAAMNPKDREELLSQEFIKDPNLSIKNLLDQAILKFGENIKIGKFIRYEL